MSPTHLAFFSFLVLTGRAASFQQGGKAQGLSDNISRCRTHPLHDTDIDAGPAFSPTAQVPDIEIDSHLVRSSLSDSMQQTLDLIKNVESLPSCAKIASSALLHSCSALEGSIKHDESDLSRGSDLFVDEEADIYSARLAVCELSGADFSIPKECQPFVPTEQSKKKRGFRGFWSKTGPSEPTALFQYYDEITLNNLQQCRKALGSTSQSWTSYSNNRQNAVVMCRAMRSEVDKDEYVHVAKVLASAAGTATVSLKDTLETFDLLRTRFSELSTAMPQFQQDLVAGNQQHLEYIQNFWSEEIERVRSSLRDVVEDADEISEGIRNSKNEITDLGSIIQKLATESSLSLHDVATQTKHELAALSDNTAALHEAHEYVLEMVKQELVKRIYQATHDLGAINSFMPVLNEELAALHAAHSRMHEESLNKHKENQAYLDQTAATLEQFNQAAIDINATMTSIFSWVGIGLPGAIELTKTTATFLGYTFVFTLISFGLWEKYAGFYLSGTILASAATGSGECQRAPITFRLC